MSATTTTFSNMLNQYLPEPLLLDEMKKRDWFMKNVDQDDSWLGGTLIVPFLGAVGSSVTFGSLAASTDIAEESTVRGTISAYKEVWSSMIFNETDLMQHGKVSEQNFLRILPDALERHADYLKGCISQNLLTGAYVALFTANGDSSGNFGVAQPDRFVIKQKLNFADNNSDTATGYVQTITLNSTTGSYNINVATTRAGGTPLDLSAFTVARVSTAYQDGQVANGFTSLRTQLLSSANGGGSTIFGVTKTAWPFTQAINISGASITSANILGSIFDAYVTIRRLGGGMPFKVVMSYKNFGSCVKSLEAQKGGYNVKPGNDSNTQAYGWSEIEVGGFAGTLTLVAVQEMDDDIIYFLDMKTIKFYTNGGIRRRKDPETGSPFYTIRNTTGYQYIVDHCLFGDFVVLQPKKNGLLFGISYT
jgi:hypothetical protein